MRLLEGQNLAGALYVFLAIRFIFHLHGAGVVRCIHSAFMRLGKISIGKECVKKTLKNLRGVYIPSLHTVYIGVYIPKGDFCNWVS